MGKDLTSKQRLAVTALLSGRNIVQSALLINVNPSTLHRWLRDEDFARALDEASGNAVKAASFRLIGMLDKAVDTLDELVERGARPGSAVRLRAAGDIVDHALRLSERADLSERLERLEQRLNAQGH